MATKAHQNKVAIKALHIFKKRLRIPTNACFENLPESRELKIYKIFLEFSLNSSNGELWS